MGIRIPVEDSAPSVAFEDAVTFVFEAPGRAPEFRDPRGRQIELDGTLARAVESGEHFFVKIKKTRRSSSTR